MDYVSVKKRFTLWCSKLTLKLALKFAGAALVLFGISSSSSLEVGSLWLNRPAQTAALESTRTQPSADKGKIRVLSRHDVALYRAAFAAQDKNDRAFADEALSNVKDKRLVGHVLADRYLRGSMSLDEARTWMSAYATLPEASDIYRKAKRLKKFSAKKFPVPRNVRAWQGFDGIDGSPGFRAAPKTQTTSLKGRSKRAIVSALRRGNPEKAFTALNAALNRGDVSVAHTHDMASRIAAAFFYKGDLGKAQSVARPAAKAGSPLALWIEGLSFWKLGKHKDAAQAFTTLASLDGLSSWSYSAAAFWAYRAEKHLGNETLAYSWLTKAAQKRRTFYGIMAAQRIAQQPKHLWKIPKLDNDFITLLAAQPSGWQALALVQVGRNDLAESELRRALSSGSRPIRKAALALAEEARMPSISLQLSSIAQSKSGKLFDAALYPLPPWRPSEGFTVDRALIYAIMRHESQFDPGAVSARGACGLMQIMPSTARHIADDPSEVSHCNDYLSDPGTNVSMGQKYVRRLAKTPFIGDNLLFLLAAYNGGPGNLSRWLSNTDRTDSLIFIESLPVRETRDYVKKVVLHYWMYRERLAEPNTAFVELAQGGWPRYSLTASSKQAAAKNVTVAMK